MSVTKYLGKSKKYIKVSSNRKVTVKKKTPKGTYKVKVAAKGSYKSATKTITIKVLIMAVL